MGLWHALARLADAVGEDMGMSTYSEACIAQLGEIDDRNASRSESEVVPPTGDTGIDVEEPRLTGEVRAEEELIPPRCMQQKGDIVETAEMQQQQSSFVMRSSDNELAARIKHLKEQLHELEQRQRKAKDLKEENGRRRERKRPSIFKNGSMADACGWSSRNSSWTQQGESDQLSTITTGSTAFASTESSHAVSRLQRDGLETSSIEGSKTVMLGIATETSKSTHRKAAPPPIILPHVPSSNSSETLSSGSSSVYNSPLTGSSHDESEGLRGSHRMLGEQTFREHFRGNSDFLPTPRDGMLSEERYQAPTDVSDAVGDEESANQCSDEENESDSSRRPSDQHRADLHQWRRYIKTRSAGLRLECPGVEDSKPAATEREDARRVVIDSKPRSSLVTFRTYALPPMLDKYMTRRRQEAAEKRVQSPGSDGRHLNQASPANDVKQHLSVSDRISPQQRHTMGVRSVDAELMQHLRGAFDRHRDAPNYPAVISASWPMPFCAMPRLVYRLSLHYVGLDEAESSVDG